ncbi:MAG: SWIM zinc finger family protein [Deltaproteobacteria bacterium]|nr:SWIM zinc finger family protein [Deltaproteobacteria bacterium]
MKQDSALGESVPWSLREIEARVGGRSVARGRLYEQAGALFDPQLEPTESGRVFVARCEGSGAEVYRVRASRHSEGLVEATCSCPVGDAGTCKHSAALLLYAHRSPSAFAVIEPFESLCIRAGGAPLLTAMGVVRERLPELEPLLRVAVSTSLGERGIEGARAHDPSSVVGTIFRKFAGDPNGGDACVTALAPLVTQARALLIAGQLETAMACLRALSCGLMARIRRFDDHEGVLRALTETILTMIARSLSRCEEGSLARQIACEALFDAYRYDAENGTVYARLVATLLASHASDQDRERVASLARAVIAHLEPFARRVIEGCLVDVEGGVLDDESFLTRCREAKRPRELVLRLLERDRIDDALRECATLAESIVVDALEVSEELGFAHAGEALVSRLAPQPPRVRALSWWRDRLVSRNDPMAWEASARLFVARPDRLLWRTLRQEAGAEWPTRREAVLDAIAQRGGAAWVEALLDEGLNAQALVAAESLSPSAAFAVRIELAERVSVDNPLAGAELLRVQAEALIGLRGRAHYREAARVLRRARELYEAIGQRGLWVSYAETLRARARELPALREELASALARSAPIALTLSQAANDNSTAQASDEGQAKAR